MLIDFSELLKRIFIFFLCILYLASVFLIHFRFFIILGIWACLLFFTILIFRKIFRNYKKTKRIITYFIITIGVWVPFWKDLPGRLLAAKQCDEYGGLSNKKPLFVEGYLIKEKRRSYDLRKIANLLITEGFQFIERKSTKYNGFARMAKGKGNYYLYYVAKINSEECEPYKYEIKNPYTEAYMRGIGLDSEHCIAVKKVSSLKSQYGFYSFQKHIGFPTFINWDHLQIKNLKNAEIYSEYTSFEYKTLSMAISQVLKNLVFISRLGNNSKNSRDLEDFFDENSESLDCKNKKDHELILNDILKPTSKSKSKNREMFELYEDNNYELNFNIVNALVELERVEDGNQDGVPFKNLISTIKYDGNVVFHGSKLIWINNRIKRNIDLSEFGYDFQIFEINNKEMYITSKLLNNIHILKLNWDINNIDVYSFKIPNIDKEGDSKLVIEEINKTNEKLQLVLLDSSRKSGYIAIKRYFFRLEY